MHHRRLSGPYCAAWCMACLMAITSNLALAESINREMEAPRGEPSRHRLVAQDCTAAQVRCQAEYNYCLSNNKGQGECERAKGLCLATAGCNNLTAPVTPPPGK